MSSKHVYEKMLSDIRLLLQSTSQLPYISGKNVLTALSIDDVHGVITAKREGNQTVAVPFDHLHKVANAFSQDEIVNIDALFQGSGNGRAVIETVVAHLPNVGYLPANKPPNTGPKKLVWFKKDVNTLGQIFDASGYMLERSSQEEHASVQSSFNLVSKSFLTTTATCNLQLSESTCLRFVSSLLAKRFCILTGLAGSGKTKLAEAFAMWLCESTEQYRIVAVGADWTSNENLLGYADALQAGQYHAPVNGVLELLLRAKADSKRPYFLILDEMNLSHVERYFADFLSAMESDNAPLSLHGAAADLALPSAPGGTVPSKLKLTKNLFMIGTVNVDETTYMFSPKVLDRANVIEFRATKDQMEAFLGSPTGINLELLEKQGVPFAAAFQARANADADVASLTDEGGNALNTQLKLDLIAVFTALESVGAEFGFRTAKEITRFMVIHKELSGDNWNYKDALDAQVLQKLMPKLHGSARKLEGVLKALADFAAEANRDLPLTREKIKRMQSRLERDGFTSFAEA